MVASDISSVHKLPVSVVHQQSLKDSSNGDYLREQSNYISNSNYINVQEGSPWQYMYTLTYSYHSLYTEEHVHVHVLYKPEAMVFERLFPISLKILFWEPYKIHTCENVCET